MKKKINIIVLMGGKSSEHEISLISGREVVRNLNEKKYSVLPIVITRDGVNWRLTSKENLLGLPDPLELKKSGNELVTKDYKEIENVQKMQNIDAVFIAMHGPYGEDGTVQGMLELAGVKYTGSGVLTSSLAMDKYMTRQFLSAHKILTPKYVVVKKNESNLNISKALGKFPFFVKPNDQGSSVGMSIVQDTKELAKAIDKAFEYSDTVLVDEYIDGKEITCAILGNENPKALPLVEIIPKGEFFDYDSKYLDGGAQEIVPARISNELTRKIQTVAIKIYKAMGCRGFARVDFILKNNKSPLFLEVNTIPGLTPMSLFPKAAKAAGITYDKLLEEIINYAL